MGSSRDSLGIVEAVRLAGEYRALLEPAVRIAPAAPAR